LWKSTIKIDLCTLFDIKRRNTDTSESITLLVELPTPLPTKLTVEIGMPHRVREKARFSKEVGVTSSAALNKLAY
jgi:hypothetical protein